MTSQLLTQARARLCFLLISGLMVFFFPSCHKQDTPLNQGNRPSSYPSEVLEKWMALELRLMRNATGIPNHALSRHFAYAGITALESMGPGLPAHQHLVNKWNGLTDLPKANPTARYYWPANVNAAMAGILKALFPTANPADKAAIDSLETVLKASFGATESQHVINVSEAFGRAVATAVYNWSETDGYKGTGAVYTPPVGPGLWEPTPPAMASPLTPYWVNNRPVIRGSLNDIGLPAPPAYATDPNSAFYQMVKQVYDASQTLTDEQKAMALFWRDIPGLTTPGHWLSILIQVVQQKSVRLDKAAYAFALAGSAGNDALIATWKAKYQYNLVRPITYIRNVLGHTAWSSFIGTPAHPEYPSAHSAGSAAVVDALQEVFGNSDLFTDHSYDYLGFAPRTYSSFRAIGEDAGASRLYGGIHYQLSIDAGLLLGRKVTANILAHPADK